MGIVQHSVATAWGDAATEGLTGGDTATGKAAPACAADAVIKLGSLSLFLIWMKEL